MSGNSRSAIRGERPRKLRNRDILSSQSVIDRGSKIAAHPDPVFVAIRPGSKFKGHSTGGEIDRVSLRRWFFDYPCMIGCDILQYLNHTLLNYAAGHFDRDFDRPASIRKRPVRRLTAKFEKIIVDVQAASPSSWKTDRMAVRMVS